MSLTADALLARLKALERWHVIGDDSSSPAKTDVTIPKPKRPFLRKRTGLERYKMTHKPPPPKSRNTTLQLKVPSGELKWRPPDPSQTSDIGEQTLELLLFEALEQQAENNTSFGSTSSNVQRLFADQKAVMNCPTVINCKQNVDDDDWSTVEEENSDELSPKVHVSKRRSDSSKCDRCQLEWPRLLHDKQIEVDSIRQECQMKLQQKVEQFEQELNRTIGAFEEALRTLEVDTELERAEIEKERAHFRKTCTNDSLTRKHRTELSHVQQELVDTRELLKLKETKNGSTQARLRTQIKRLQTENDTLKGEIDRLTRQNGRLTAAQKLSATSKRSSTGLSPKVLNELNRNITRLMAEKLPTNYKQNDNRNDLSLLAVEKQYAQVFGAVLSTNDSCHPDDICSPAVDEERRNTKTTTDNGNVVTLTYLNGDEKVTNHVDGTVKYWYCDERIWTTHYADGTECIEFPNGQCEKRQTDGTRIVQFPHNVRQTIYPDGREEIHYADGSVLERIDRNQQILKLPNGQKEIHTSDQKKREYPDGTVKILYNDGTQETRYANGRVRIKDPNGTLVRDTCHNS